MTDGDRSKAWRRWRIGIFASTWWAYAGLYFCRKTFYAAKDPLSDALGFDERALGMLGAIYLVAYTIGQFAAGGLGQKTGPRVLFLSGMAVSVVANIAFAFTNEFWVYGAFMAVNGLAQATGWAACMGTLGNWTTRTERGTIMGFWATCYQLGGVMATSWAGLWISLQGWRGSFLAGSVVLLGSWFFVLCCQRDRPEDVGLPAVDDGESVEAGVEGKGERAQWTRAILTTIVLVGLCYVGIKFIRYTVWSWSAYFLSDYYGLTPGRAAVYSTIFDTGGFLGVIAAGWASDRYFEGRRAKLSFFMLLGMAGGCAVLFLLGGQSVAWFLTGMILVGFMLYGPDSLLSGAGAIEVGSRRTAVAAAGIINGMGSFGAVVQEFVVAELYSQNGQDVGAVFGLLLWGALLSLGALGWVLWRNRRGISDL